MKGLQKPYSPGWGLIHQEGTEGGWHFFSWLDIIPCGDSLWKWVYFLEELTGARVVWRWSEPIKSFLYGDFCKEACRGHCRAVKSDGGSLRWEEEASSPTCSSPCPLEKWKMNLQATGSSCERAWSRELRYRPGGCLGSLWSKWMYRIWRLY